MLRLDGCFSAFAAASAAWRAAKDGIAGLEQMKGMDMEFRRVIFALVLLLAGMGMAQELVLLQGMARGGTPQSERDRFFSQVRRHYVALGIAYRVFRDDAVTAANLETAKLVVMPYNAPLPAASRAVLQDFVARGGKLALFYHSDPALLSLLGIEATSYRGGTEMRGAASIRFAVGALPSPPALLPHPSWNIMEPTLKAGSEAKIIGVFVAADGRELPLSAVVLSENGLYFPHVLLGEDLAASRRFLMAMTAHFIPGLWEQALQTRLEKLGKVGGLDSFEALQARLRHLDHAEGNRVLTEARACLDSAKNLRRQQRYGEALHQAEEAHRLARRAYVLSSPSRSCELRGVWIHSAYGIADWGWDKTVKVLAEQGFNAIFPNMLWGYVADYPSEVLPVHPRVASAGDQIQQCLDACRKHGLEMHVWKVNWNMGSHTPEELRQQMVAAGRTQMTSEGKETRYLAPHIQENYELELAAMLEVARNYSVDGIHFDYIRYPGADADFSPSARESFEAQLGRVVPEWPKDCMSGGALRREYNLWRANNISRLVESVYREAKKIRPDVMVSAALFPDWDSAPHSIAQPSDEWIAKGWLDFVCPMNYTVNNAALERYLRRQLASVGQSMPLYAGLGCFLHDDAAATSEQIQLARSLGAAGLICFQHSKGFAENFLPDLGSGPMSLHAGKHLPHHWPPLSFERKAPKAERNYAAINEQLEWQLVAKADAGFPRDLRVSLAVDGARSEQTVKTRRRGRDLHCSVTAKIAGAHQLELSDGQRGVFGRSPALDVLSAEALAERLLQEGPPQFAKGKGLRVGIWQHDAYGAAPLLSALQAEEGFNAAPLHNLQLASLQACQVVILPQPRKKSELFRDDAYRELLRNYVSGGGRLLVTHALVGIRSYVNAFPELVATAVEPALPGVQWRIKGRHPATSGLGPEFFHSTFSDRIAMTPGSSGRVIAEAPGGEAVMIVGQFGKGRYAACGLGIAIGTKDKDSDLSSAERTLLLSSLRWLGERAPVPKGK
jgi:uncharacterized lipoprotein YddW (UPF0748 family)